MTIAIIGAGLAGLSAAHALVERGVGGIVVFDRREGPGLETSFANGALLHPSLVEPWNSPGVIGQLLRTFGQEDAAALLRLRALPSLVGWGLAFARESRPNLYLRNTLVNLALARLSVDQMAGIRASGLAYDHQPRGSLVLFRDVDSQRAALAWAERLAAHGLHHERMDVAAAVAREPALAAIAPELVGAIYHADDESGDAQRYCVELAARLAAAGVGFRYGTRVHGLEAIAGCVAALRTDNDRLPVDTVILAAASHSPQLARTVGLSLPVRPAKGYSVTIPLAGDAFKPRTPVIDPALHVAVVPVGDDRLRVAGTAEFCGLDLTIRPKRVANLVRQMARLYPAIVDATPAERRSVWAGLRPMTPDGVPLIGATAVRGLYLNTGHGHLGWTLAAGSASVLADVFLGRRPALDPEPYALARFATH